VRFHRRPSGHRTVLGQAWYDVWKGTFEILLTYRPIPSGHRSMFYESNGHRWEATCIYIRTYCIYINNFILKNKNINIKIYISLEQLRMNTMQRTSAINFCSFVQVLFSPPLLSESSLIFFILTTCFFGGMMANFDINVYIIARETLFHPCKIGLAQYGIRLISYNAGWAPYDIIISRRRLAPER